MKSINSRSLNIEILRIISMFMILTLHYLGQGNVLTKTANTNWVYYLVWIIEAISLASVNLYMLISGFFLFSKKFTWNRLLSLYSQIFFYSIILSCLCFYLKIEPVTMRNLVSILPFVSRNNWYVTTYIALLLITPLLNAAIMVLNAKTHKFVLLVGFFLFSLIPSTFFFVDQFNVNKGYSLLWYSYVYICGAYISKYDVKILNRKIVFLCPLILLVPASKFLIVYYFPSFEQYSSFLYTYNSFPIFGTSIIIFLTVKDLYVDLKNSSINQIILIFAKNSFACFYIHTYVLLRDHLWGFMGSEHYLNQWLQFPHLLVCILIVYFLCTIIEMLRLKIFDVLNINRNITVLSVYLDKKTVDYF